MEFQPDKRHLLGGLAASALLTLWLVYQGMGSPGDVYFHPEYAGHPAGSVYAAQCADCHVHSWKPAENEGCIVCHGKTGARQRKIPRPGQPAVAAEETAGEKFHKAAEDQRCASCHLEHRPSELDVLLKIVPIEARRKDPAYPRAIHALIPEKYRGQEGCFICHTPTELETFEKTGARK